MISHSDSSWASCVNTATVDDAWCLVPKCDIINMQGWKWWVFKQKHHQDRLLPVGFAPQRPHVWARRKHTLTHKLENVQVSISKWKLVPGASACRLESSGLLKISTPGQRALHADVGPRPCQRVRRRRHLCTRCHHICLIKLPCRYVLTPFYLFIFPSRRCLPSYWWFIFNWRDRCLLATKAKFGMGGNLKPWNESHKRSLFFLHMWCDDFRALSRW